jgi:hypothetical protein
LVLPVLNELSSDAAAPHSRARPVRKAALLHNVCILVRDCVSESLFRHVRRSTLPFRLTAPSICPLRCDVLNLCDAMDWLAANFAFFDTKKTMANLRILLVVFAAGLFLHAYTGWTRLPDVVVTQFDLSVRCLRSFRRRRCHSLYSSRVTRARAWASAYNFLIGCLTLLFLWAGRRVRTSDKIKLPGGQASGAYWLAAERREESVQYLVNQLLVRLFSSHAACVVLLLVCDKPGCAREHCFESLHAWCNVHRISWLWWLARPSQGFGCTTLVFLLFIFELVMRYNVADGQSEFPLIGCLWGVAVFLGIIIAGIMRGQARFAVPVAGRAKKRWRHCVARAGAIKLCTYDFQR